MGSKGGGERRAREHSTKTIASWVAVPASWLAGIALQLQSRELLPIAVAWGLLGLGLSSVIAVWRWRSLFVGSLLGVALVAFATTSLRAAHRLSQELPASLEGRDVVVIGIVATLPQRVPDGVRFRFDVESAELNGQPIALPGTLAVGWYLQAEDDEASGRPREWPRAGQRWRFTLRLKRPHGHLNPHGFDYELLLFEQHVRATGYVRHAEASPMARDAGRPIERARQRVRDAIEAAVPDRRAAGVLAALSVGDQSAIERGDWDIFRDTGIAHLVSISGLHVTMFAWLAAIGAGRLWRCMPRALLGMPAPHVARWTGVVAAFSYAVCSGFGVPSQRTVWMLATVALLHSGSTHWPWTLVLLWAAMVVTTIDPWALLQPGFWLSFAAVGLLMASSAAHAAATVAAVGGWSLVRRRLAEGVRAQGIAALGLTPLTLVVFQQISLVGFVANLFAIPLVTLFITPLALLGMAWAPLWSLGASLVQGMTTALSWLASWPAAVWMVPSAPLWAQAAGLCAAVLAILPWPWRLRVLALPLIWPLLWPPLERPQAGRFELVAVDVGQGTAVLVRTRHHVLLYDSGPRYSRDSDAGERALWPLLRSRGETHLDAMVLSHRDLDHTGGAATLLRRARVAQTITSLEDGHPLRSMMPRHRRCEAGQSWEWDGVRFELLWPVIDRYDSAGKPNTLSCVLRVSGRDGRALLTGDIERLQELQLAATRAADLGADVLLVPHHGSKTSSTDVFIDAVRPRIAVFQAGYRNRFGHPAPVVVERYRSRDMAIVSSAECGAWTWRSGELQGVCERERRRRYWHDVPRHPGFD